MYISDYTYQSKKANNRSSKRYTNNFSWDGLSRVFTGPPVERVFWFFVVVVLLACFSYLVYLLVVDYERHEIRTEVRMLAVDEIDLPKVTVCLQVR